MSGPKRTRAWIAFGIATMVLGWCVLAFGTAMDPPRPEHGKAIPHRSVARIATLVGGIACYFLLPARRRFPRVPQVFAGAAILLLAFGWFMTANACAEHSLKTWRYTFIESRISWAPGSVARAASLWQMIELSAVFLAVLAVLRACETSAWRGLIALLAGSGAVVAVIGFAHKVGGHETVWGIADPSQPGESIFAPFVYNANAGAYMNLCLPLAMGLAFSCAGDERKRSLGIVWATVAVFTAAGVVVAASKGAIIVLALTVPAMLWWNRRRLRLLLDSFLIERGRRLERLLQVGALAIVALATVAIGISYVIRRWGELFERLYAPGEMDVTGRFELMKVMARMARWDEGSWHGFGPGTLPHLFPYFNTDPDATIGTNPIFGHCDPMQTIVEWGWLGAAAWFAIGIGAVICGLRLLRRRTLLTAEETPLVRGAVVALAMVGLHSCQDFPLSVFSIHLAAMLLCGVCWGLASARMNPRGKHRPPDQASGS